MRLETTDCMIDLETLGTGPDAVVISIGAVMFNPQSMEINSTFYMALEIQEQLNRGRKIDSDTLKWWMQQSDAAKRVFNEKAKTVKEVLETLAWWIKENSNVKKIKVWGNGSSFDISIMDHLYRMYDAVVPWGFNNVNDLRTFRRFDAENEKVEKLGIDHNALDDAKSQALFVSKHWIKRLQDKALLASLTRSTS